MDLFDDILVDPGVTTSARAGGKFQPKGKPRPRRQAATSVPSAPGSDITEKNNVVPNPGDITKNIVMHQTLDAPEALSNNNNKNGDNFASEMERSTHSMILNATSSHAFGDSNSLFTTDEEMVASTGMNFNPLESFLFEEPSADDNLVRKFQPRMKPCLRRKASIANVSTLASDGVEDRRTFSSVDLETERCVDTGKNVVFDLTIQSSSASEIIGSKELLAVPSDGSAILSDDITMGIPVVSERDVVADGSGDLHSSFQKSPGENVDIFSELDCLDDYLNQPECGEASTTVGTSPCGSVGQDHTCSDPNTEVPDTDAPTNLAETCNFHSVFMGNVQSDHLAEIPEEFGVKTGEGISSTNSKLPLKHKKNCNIVNEYSCGPSARQLRNRVSYQHDDERVDEACEDGEFLEEPPSDINDNDYNDNEMLGLNINAFKKSKKDAAENEKPVRKRKTAGEGARSELAGKCPKRFPHSSRRKKRQVDKTLLDTPEDEIEFSKIRFKDLIIYHEYKERLANKMAKKQLPNDGADSGVNKEGSHHGEDEFASEQQRGSDDDDEAYIKVDSNSEYFNYHSFMNKTPRAKWSKQDTHLFYEAVRQFGTDFYMIQQLFPGRTHHQIKLKFKNEERQHPLQLSDAMTSRSKDHSHFISLMAQLQQESTQEKNKSDEDELTKITRVESELNPEANEEEVAKTEVDEEHNKEEEVASPSKSYEEDDDPYKWSQYNSDL